MEWVTFKMSEEDSKAMDSWINAIPQKYHDLYLHKLDYWDVWRKQNLNDVDYIVATYNKEFSDYVINYVKDYKIEQPRANLTGYSIFAGDTFYKSIESRRAEEYGAKYLHKIQEKYQNNYLKKSNERLEKIFSEMIGHEFRFFALIGVSYLEELLKECVKSSFGKDKAKYFFGKNSREFTFSFCINYLYAQGIIDETTRKALDCVREIRNTVAHNAIIEKSDQQKIQDIIKNLKELTPSDLLWTEKTVIADKDQQIQQVYPIIENLGLIFLLLNAYIIPQQKLVRLYYDKVNGGFRVAQDVVVFNHLSMHYFDLKFEDLGIDGFYPAAS